MTNVIKMSKISIKLFGVVIANALLTRNADRNHPRLTTDGTDYTDYGRTNGTPGIAYEKSEARLWRALHLWVSVSSAVLCKGMQQSLLLANCYLQ
jgi:hypothetical protein